MDILLETLKASWQVVVEAGPWLIVGFLLAGLIRAFLSPQFISHYLGKKSTRSVMLASLFGVPLPLCSCSVLPVAATLKRQGASPGAVTAFLISTPESGADSVAVSWALLDPIMTVFRPIAAFVTAAVAGLVENLIGTGHYTPEVHAQACAKCNPRLPRPPAPPPLVRRLIEGVRFAFLDLLPEMAGWLLLMFVITGFLSAVIPDGFIQYWLPSGWVAMPLMLVIGIPIYVCATASTPIAAALILKGLSPGAALVFLLAGPATNLATMGIVKSLLGLRALVIYLVAICVSALTLGALLDGIYAWTRTAASARLGIHQHALVGGVAEQVVGAVSFALLLWAFARYAHKHKHEKESHE